MDLKDDFVTKLLKDDFDKIVKTSDPDVKWKAVLGFCDVAIRERNGPVHAARVLSSEMQAPNEDVALKALDVLEACVRRCGPRFQSEIGKFRFLNEIVKLVSPRYLGKRTSERVKSKSIELLYVWTQLLPDEPKIKEAYEMLKAQKLIDEDPDVPLCINAGAENDQEALTSTPSQHPADDIFSNDERSSRLRKLLQSRNPHDLQEANKLIKKIVSENEQKQAKVSWRMSELGRVQTIVGVLSEMLSAYQPTSSSVEEKETLKQLFNSCLELRPGLQRIAEQTDDAEKDAFVNIVNASEDLNSVIKDYEYLVNGKGSPSNRRKSVPKDSSCLLDLDLLSLSPHGNKAADCSTDQNGQAITENQSQLLEDIFGPAVESERQNGTRAGHQSDYCFLSDFSSSSVPSTVPPQLIPRMSSASTLWDTNAKPVPPPRPETEKPIIAASSSSMFEDIEKMARERLSINKKTNEAKDDVKLLSGLESGDPPKLVTKPSNPGVVDNSAVRKPAEVPLDAKHMPSVTNLSEVVLSIDDVNPGDGDPVELVNTADVSLSLTSARAEALPELSIAVLTFTNRSKCPLSDYVFKAVVTPKTVPVKVLPALETSLPPCKAFKPPPVLTQLLIASNPQKIPLSLKFVLCYTKNEDDLESERGAVDNLIF